MTPDRRTLLKGFSLLPLAGAPVARRLHARGAAAGPIRFVVDARMPGARALAATAQRQRQALDDAQGEIVAYVLAQGPDWLSAGGPVIGLTSYSDMMLMRDLARGAGRPLRYAALMHGKAPPLIDRLDGAQAAFLAALRDGPPIRPGRASGFLWLV